MIAVLAATFFALGLAAAALVIGASIRRSASTFAARIVELREEAKTGEFKLRYNTPLGSSRRVSALMARRERLARLPNSRHVAA